VVVIDATKPEGSPERHRFTTLPGEKSPIAFARNDEVGALDQELNPL
jgi:hypothetical protein